MQIVLASASPRRREILSALGIDHVALVPDVEELHEGEPEAVVMENARRKARWGLDAAAGEAIALGADTDVVLDGLVLGKPAGEQEARATLESLSGRTHEVLTGVVLASHDGERSGVARSRVGFRELDGVTLGRYLACGEWRDRSGAYAIQGLGSILIERLEGDLSNVVGLPVPLLLDLAPELF